MKLQELIELIRNQIRWFSSKEELKQYFTEKDWETEYDFHQEESELFRKKVKDLT